MKRTFPSKLPAFTLMEILGAAAIIILVSTVAINGVMGFVESGREAAARENARTIAGAYQRYLSLGGTPVGFGSSTQSVPVQNAMINYDGWGSATMLNVLCSQMTLPGSDSMVGPFLAQKPDTSGWGVGSSGLASDRNKWIIAVYPSGSVKAQKNIYSYLPFNYWGSIGDGTWGSVTGYHYQQIGSTVLD